MPRSSGASNALRAPLSLEMACCARALAGTVAGQHLDLALDLVCDARLAASSHAPVRDMAYATMRGLGIASFLADRLNARKPAPALAALQWVALTALLETRRAPAIVIDQAVSAARDLAGAGGAGGAAGADNAGAGKAAAGFINATLRRFLRERESLLAQASTDIQASHNLPRWWVELLMQHYPASWREIVAAGARKAPLTLRVNSRAADVDTIAARLTAAGIGWRRTGLHAITLSQAMPVERIPGFAEGLVSVQDAGAQLAAPLLDPRDGDRVLDACAAPGGKTTHLLELADCEVLALELDPKRALRIRENLQRQRLDASVVVGDVTRPHDWWDGRAFDRIMLDAPCSASGIVRRHPDVPWHRRRSDIATFARGQQRLLDALWPLLKPGGTLVYITCSIFPEEGESVISAFCSQHSDAERRPSIVRWAHEATAVSQLLPTGPAGPVDPSDSSGPGGNRNGSESSDSDRREHDGFYYALLSKRT